MQLLTRHTGMWAGTNRFRLMPDDPLAEASATAQLSLGAGGNVALFNFGGATHYVADLAGYFVDPSLRVPPGPEPHRTLRSALEAAGIRVGKNPTEVAEIVAEIRS